MRVHPDEYLARIKELSSGRGGDAGSETPFGNGSYEIAQLAAGGTIAAIDAVLDGTVANAYALVRPPGHHALADLGMGFCIFANVAVGVRHAQAARGLGRVAVVDWDVHHGNGTQAIFWEDPSVLAISLHQDGLYPSRSGLHEQVGESAGKGTTLNVPLPAGSGSGAYLAAVDQVVVPALEAFAPELIVIACGFDAGALDPLGRMLLAASAFGEMTGRLLDAADRICGGRLVASHEGGYSAGHVPFCGLAVHRGDVRSLRRDRGPVRLPVAQCPARSSSRTSRPRSTPLPLSLPACPMSPRLVLVLSENWTLTPPATCGRSSRWRSWRRRRASTPSWSASTSCSGRAPGRTGSWATRATTHSREPGSRDAVAELARAALGDRGGDDATPARRQCRARTAPAPAAPRP